MCRFRLEFQNPRILGYHKNSSDSSIRSYSRDKLAEPIRQLKRVLESIRDGTFNPEKNTFSTPTGRPSERPQEIQEDSGDEGPEVSPFKFWGPLASKDDSHLDEISPTAHFVATGADGSVGGVESKGEDFVDDDSDAATELTMGDSDVDRCEWVASNTLAICQADASGDCRLFRNANTGKIHKGKPGCIEETRCGNDASDYQLLASGTDDVEEKWKCLKCYRLISCSRPKKK